MPRSNWRYVAPALFGLAIATSLIGFTYDTAVESARNSEKAKRYSAYYAAVAEQRIRETCRDLVTLAKCAREIVAAEHEQQRSEADLQWQREAAQWAWWAVIVALGQGLVGAVGLWALLRTIRQGDDALNVAREANNETRHIGEAQVRCYVHLAEATVKINQWGAVVVRIVFKNIGQSPAEQFKFAFSISYMGVANDAAFYQHNPRELPTSKPDDFRGSGFIGPGDRFEQHITSGQPMTAEQFATFTTQGSKLFVQFEVRAWWIDVFENEFSRTNRRSAEISNKAYGIEHELGISFGREDYESTGPTKKANHQS
jgi:hypothetical protein